MRYLFIFLILIFALPVFAANDFSGDSNCVALYNLESGALTTDSKGSNDLTDNNTVGTSGSDYQQGSYSADFERDTAESLTVTDANLDSGFPLKSDGSGVFSVTFWVKPESNSNNNTFVSKYDAATNGRSINLYSVSNRTVYANLGYNSGNSYEILTSSYALPAVGEWYHFGFTFNDSDKTWKLRIYREDTDTVVSNQSGTATNNIYLGSVSNFALGTYYVAGALYGVSSYDGLMDEVVVFKDILTTDEIDEIRSGTYGAAAATRRIIKIQQ